MKKQCSNRKDYTTKKKKKLNKRLKICYKLVLHVRLWIHVFLSLPPIPAVDKCEIKQELWHLIYINPIQSWHFKNFIAQSKGRKHFLAASSVILKISSNLTWDRNAFNEWKFNTAITMQRFTQESSLCCTSLSDLEKRMSWISSIHVKSVDFPAIFSWNVHLTLFKYWTKHDVQRLG